MTENDTTKPDRDQNTHSRDSAAGKDYIERVEGDFHQEVNYYYPQTSPSLASQSPSKPAVPSPQNIDLIKPLEQSMERAYDWNDARIWLEQQKATLVDTAIDEIITNRACVVSGLDSKENRQNIITHLEWILHSLKKRDATDIPLKQFVQEATPRTCLAPAYKEVFASMIIQVRQTMKHSPKSLPSNVGNSLSWFLAQIIKLYS